MRKVSVIWLGLCALMLAGGPAYAAKPRAYLLGGGHTNMSSGQWHTDRNGLRSGTFGYVHNLFGIYADGAYSCMFTSMPNVQHQPGGYGAGGGLAYEHQRGMFKLQIGLGVRYQDVKNRVNDTTFYDGSVHDDYGYPYTLRYDFFSRVDRAVNVHAQVPILAGLGVRGFYFLSGVKLNCTFRGRSYVSATGTTTGLYEQFLGQFTEMDNHGFRKAVQLERTGVQLDLKTDVLLSLETGYEWGKDIRTHFVRSNGLRGDHLEYRLRVAAFVDYGLMNICPKSDQSFIYIPKDYKWDFPAYEMHHVFATNMAQPYSVHNFYVGVKLTAMLGVYTYKRCILCSGFETEADMGKRGNKGK